MLICCAICAMALMSRPRLTEACSKIHVDMFTEFDGAQRVLVASVTSAPEDKSKLAVIALESPLKGARPGKATVEIVQNVICGPVFGARQRFIGFFNQELLFRELVAWSGEAASALERWGHARTPQARLALLSELANSKDRAVAMDASDRLAIERRRLKQAERRG